MVNKVAGVVALITENVLVFTSLVLLTMRLYVRCWLQAKFDWADGMLIAAWISSALDFGMDAFDYHNGFWAATGPVITDKGAPDLQLYYHNDDKLRASLKSIYASISFYYATIWLIKGSFLYLYYDLIPRSFKRLRVALHVTTAFTVSTFFATLITTLFWCTPVHKNWEVNRSQACYAVFETPPYLIMMGSHLISDILIYALPFFLLPTLRYVGGSSLAGLIAVFSLGGVAIAITVTRAAILGVSVWMPTFAIWTAAEQTAAFAVACAPPLKWLWKSFRAYGVRGPRTRGTYADGVGTVGTNIEQDADVEAGSNTTGRNSEVVTGAVLEQVLSKDSSAIGMETKERE